MPKIVSTISLILMFVLMIPAGLIMISQDSVKGDWNYPIKRGLEDVILVVASFTPYTKAYFAVALSNRRYEETQRLLSKGVSAYSSLEELVSQTSTAASDINKISNSTQKARLIANLSSSIEKYDKGLAQAQEDITRRSGVVITPSPTPISTVLPSPSALPISTFSPSALPSPSQSPSRPPVVNQNNEELLKQQQAIEKTRRELDELRKQLQMQQTPSQSSPMQNNFLPSQGSSERIGPGSGDGLGKMPPPHGDRQGRSGPPR